MNRHVVPYKQGLLCRGQVAHGPSVATAAVPVAEQGASTVLRPS